MTTTGIETPLEPQLRFTPAQVREVETLIDASGIVALLDPLLPTGGRPRTLPLRTLLVGIGLTAAGNTALYLNRIHTILTALPGAARRRLGITTTDTRGREHTLTLRQVEHLYDQLAKLLDASPHFHGRHLDHAARTVADERLQLLTQLLLGASLPPEWTPNGHVAVDATFIDANSRPEHTLRKKQINKAAARAVAAGRARDLASLLADDSELAKALGIPDFGEDPDIDASRLKRLRKASRRVADPDAATIVHKQNLRHAYAAHLAVTIGSESDVAGRLAHEEDLLAALEEDRDVRVTLPEPTPHLILGLALTASTAPAAATAVDLTRRMTDGPRAQAEAADVDAGLVPDQAGLPAGDTVADRGYTEAVPSDYHHPLRAMGRRLVFDLHQNRRGVTGTHRGAIVAFGNLYSPGITNYPDLVTNAAPSPFAAWEEWQRYFRDAQLRAGFRLKTNGRADTDGYGRFGCPAQRRGATLACPVRDTLDLVGGRGLLEVFIPPIEPRPDVCTQTSLTVPPDVTARSMDLEWGSKAWYDSYIRRRPRVEGMNGIIKNPTFSALAHMTVRVRGRAKVGLLTVFAAAITNLRAGKRWRAELARVRKLNDAITGARKRRTRRRTHTLVQLLPAKHRVKKEPAAARAP
ncbi:hypothetical protein [Nocardioides sp. MH1]|uniref:hypothetical protein n=1 Tax=Nocardioides sp. MH1 TaxID=3242490 RepID=UPI003522DF0A